MAKGKFFVVSLTDCLRVPLQRVPVVLRLVELVSLVLLRVGQAERGRGGNLGYSDGFDSKMLILHNYKGVNRTWSMLMLRIVL